MSYLYWHPKLKLDIVKLMISAGADMKCKDHDDCSCLLYAMVNKSITPAIIQ